MKEVHTHLLDTPKRYFLKAQEVNWLIGIQAGITRRRRSDLDEFWRGRARYRVPIQTSRQPSREVEQFDSLPCTIVPLLLVDLLEVANIWTTLDGDRGKAAGRKSYQRRKGDQQV